MNWSRIARSAAGLAALIALAMMLPLWIHQAQSPNQAVPAHKSTLQERIEAGDLQFPINPKAEDFPYKSISLERGPCFGNCPVYLVTFYPNGTATRVSDYMLPDRRRGFVGEISLLQYARLCQLVDSARKSAGKARYAATHTDDYTATIVAEGADGTWRVSDYGQVAPVQVWVLEQMLHSYQESTEWRPGHPD